MNAETVANIVRGLGKADFKRVVSLYLERFFGLTAVNVDGQFDGGSDYSMFNNSGRATTVACQDTTQKAGWYEKAKKDARNSVAKLNATRFIFLTNAIHSNTKLRSLEHEIYEELHIPATCLSGREIAEFIYEQGLVPAFLDAIEAPLAAGISGSPDRQEIALYAYVTLSDDSQQLKTTVYEDTILITLYDNGPLKNEDLINKCLKLLGLSEFKQNIFVGRIDSLLARGKILRLTDKTITLSPTALQDVQNAERIYFKEFDTMASGQIDLVEEKCGTSWTKENCRQISTLLARAFIIAQIQTAKSAKASLTAVGLFDLDKDPLQEIRNYLSQNGVTVPKIQEVLKELIDQAKDAPIIKKLCRAAVFVALEGANPITAVKAIGASQWSDVKVMIDASVAIPYLCASLYKPTNNRFSAGNFNVTISLRKLSANLRISNLYIDECASHLMIALRYNGLNEYSDSLTFSRNAYVAHYYQLLRTEANVPQSLEEYLANFSKSCVGSISDQGKRRRQIMSDLQALFRDYGVELEPPTTRLHSPEIKDIEIAYSYKMHELHRAKPEKLIDHDVKVMGHIRKGIQENGEHWILLSWDRAIIALGQEKHDFGLIVSPEVLSDFIQSCRPQDEMHLCALAHSIARTENNPLEITAQILDRVVQKASDKMQDWQFKKDVNKFTTELLNRIDLSDANFPTWVLKETDEFLRKAGITIPGDEDVETSPKI